ncbi:EF-hand domain-containing protein [Aureibaculum sp. A20]|uniref:EF-hand domain-containing protein n=1 Tax=Aureibaculum flavum TaxID=2795986 RepID=A0ABS0WN42_9FLAO|nr:EF-hand domain-containing protein [Aureibaculum flavum]MBJ2173390.1 EF-hand domain-containing protein [Aureibaculum flavum]
MDTNNDDKIDVDEASKDQRGEISQDFDLIDTNDDKYIDLSELEASLNGKGPKGESAEKIMKEVDDNADGKLNAIEIAAKEKLLLTNNFEEIDTNDDNEIDLEELKYFLSKSDKKKSKKRKKQ